MFYRGPFYHQEPYRVLPSASTLRPLLPLLMTQLVWWAAVLSGGLLAAVTLAVQLALTLWLDRSSLPKPSRLLWLLASGLALDVLTVQLGLIQFRDAALLGIPIWLGLLWLSFVLTVPRLQQWLPQRAMQLLVFAVSAPLAYVAGAAFGAATIHEPVAYGAVMVVGWSLLTLLWQPRSTRHLPPVTTAREELPR